MTEAILRKNDGSNNGDDADDNDDADKDKDEHDDNRCRLWGTAQAHAPVIIEKCPAFIMF